VDGVLGVARKKPFVQIIGADAPPSLPGRAE
jgi:hypothetical protein